MRGRHASSVAATLLATACTPPSLARPGAPPAPSATVIAAPLPAAASIPPAPAEPSAPAAPADPEWQARCASSIDEGLAVAAARDSAFAAKVAQRDGNDEVSVSFLGFVLHVRRVRPDLANRDAPGIWQHRAEVLGGYHVTYLKETETLSAGFSFGGWDARRVQPLARIFQAAIARCFVAK